MARMSWNTYAKANAIELSTWQPQPKANDPFKSTKQVRAERKSRKVTGKSKNPHNFTPKVKFMQRSVVDAENTGYVYEPVEVKPLCNNRTIFITFNKNKVIVQG